MRLTDLNESSLEVISRLGITHEDYNAAFRAVLHYPEKIEQYLDYGDELQFLAVSNDGYTIRFISDPSPRLQMTAVQHSPFAIRAIQNPTPAVQVAAVERYPTALENIAHPCLEAIRAVIWKQGASALRMVKSTLTPEMIKLAIERDAGGTVELFDHMPVDLQQLAFQTNPYSIAKLRRLTNFDTALEKEFEQKQRQDKKAHRADQRLPKLGDRRPIGAVNQDQLAGLRWLELNNANQLSVRVLKQQPWGNTPFWQELIRKTGGRDITRSDITNANANSAVREIMDVVRVTAGTWDRDEQRIFTDRKNQIAIYSVLGGEVADSLSDRDKQLMIDVKTQSPHPKAQDEPNWAAKGSGGLVGLSLGPNFKLDKRYTMGWVRYTVFGRDIWIDEVQSDLPKYLEPEANLRFKGIQDAILVDFLARMRRRGAGKFYMPTIEMKRSADLYKADPPQSIYTDLPKKMRMRKEVLAGIDPKVDGQTGWVLEGLDRSAQWSWETNEADHAIATFRCGGSDFSVSFSGRETVSLTFYNATTDGDGIGIVGGQDARGVFATMAAIIKAYMADHRPAKLYWTARASEKSRQRLYDRLCQTLSLPGYRFERGGAATVVYRYIRD